MMRVLYAVYLSLFCISATAVLSQPPGDKQKVRTVTIPISIFTKQEIKKERAEEFVQVEQLMVKEDNDEQQILSIRSNSDSPLSIALLIQDDLTAEFNLHLADIGKFIRALPKGSRVMVAYLRGGSMQVRQKFTDDLDHAAKSLRIVAGNASAAPRDPYDSVNEALGKFDAVPTGRHAILLFSDGLDSNEGLNMASVAHTSDLDQVTLKAQRKGVPVYSIYFPATYTGGGRSDLIVAAQGAMSRLSEETGGRTFIHGTGAPINLDPYFNDLMLSLNRQFALTYLSTHMKKGHYKVRITSTNPDVKIEHPSGYYYR